MSFFQTSDACPACGKAITWYHLLLKNINAPFYMKCPHCKTKLRLPSPGDLWAAYLWPIAIMTALATPLLLLPFFPFVVRAVAAALVAMVVGVGWLLLYPLRGGRLALRRGGLLEDAEARRYLLNGMASILTLLVLCIPIGVALGLAVVWREGVGGGPKFPEGNALPNLGELDPGWKLRYLDGREATAGELRGKTLFVNVWATWCGPCVMEMPGIQSLQDSLKGEERIAFLVVSQEEEEVVKAFVARRGWALPMATTEGGLPQVLRSEGIPLTCVVDPRGQVVFRAVGSTNWNTEACRAFLRGVR